MNFLFSPAGKCFMYHRYQLQTLMYHKCINSKLLNSSVKSFSFCEKLKNYLLMTHPALYRVLSNQMLCWIRMSLPFFPTYSRLASTVDKTKLFWILKKKNELFNILAKHRTTALIMFTKNHDILSQNSMHRKKNHPKYIFSKSSLLNNCHPSCLFATKKKIKKNQ